MNVIKKNIQMNSNFIMTALLLASGFQSIFATNKQSSPKNIVFIAVDDLKPVLGCYGDEFAKTPNIDRLSKRGTLFTHAYCQQAVSGPSRSSLLTGMCPDNTQVWDLKTLIRSKNPQVITLPQHFKQQGYTVAGIGKIYDPRSVDKASDQQSWSIPFMDHEVFIESGFEKPVMSQYQDPETRTLYNKYKQEAESKGLRKREVEKYIQQYIKPSTESAQVPDAAYNDGAIALGAVSFIKEYQNDNPFFLAVGFKKPHLPFCAPRKYWDLYQRDEIQLAPYHKKAKNSPDFAYHNCGELKSYTDIPSLMSFSDIENVVLPDEKARELIHGYYACVSYTDAMIGQVLDAIEEKGISDNTIIVLWGDHGWHLGDHGLWNKHTNFEQATHVPMMIIDPSIKAQKVSTPVEFLDIYPTLCELVGINKPTHLDGQSLLPLILAKDAGNIKSYAASQYPRVNKMGYSIRDERYRYTIWVDWSNKKTDVSKVVAEELYDYEKDPNETVNVINNPEYTNAVKQMKTYWADYCKKRIH